MDRERLRQPSLPEAVSEVLSDLTDLFRKELRLARAELSANLASKLRGGVWLGVAGLLGLAAFALVLAGLVAWIATFDLSLHVAFLIVAAGVGMLSLLAYLTGRPDAQTDIVPSRTISQVKQDIETTKEQLT